MSPANKQIRVVALCDPGPTLQQITEALKPQNEFVLVDILASKEMLAKQIRSAEPDIILVDSKLNDESTMDIIDDLALQFPNSAIIAILPTNDPLVAQQVMLAGARAFLIAPFSQINLVSTLRRVSELESRRAADSDVHPIFVARSDASFAFHYGIQSTRWHGCLIDCSQYGHRLGRRNR